MSWSSLAGRPRPSPRRSAGWPIRMAPTPATPRASRRRSARVSTRSRQGTEAAVVALGDQPLPILACSAASCEVPGTTAPHRRARLPGRPRQPGPLRIVRLRRAPPRRRGPGRTPGHRAGPRAGRRGARRRADAGRYRHSRGLRGRAPGRAAPVVGRLAHCTMGGRGGPPTPHRPRSPHARGDPTHPGPDGRGCLHHRPGHLDGGAPGDDAAEAAPRRGARGRRQDRDRQGPGPGPRDEPDPAPVLRGPRRVDGALRVELPEADPPDPDWRRGTSGRCRPRRRTSSRRTSS